MEELPSQAESPFESSSQPDSPIEGLKRIVRKVALLSDEAASIEIIDPKVGDYLEEIKSYLLSLIERLEEENPPPEKRIKSSSGSRDSGPVSSGSRGQSGPSGSGGRSGPSGSRRQGVGSRRTNRGARNQNESEEGDKRDTPSSQRKRLPAGSIRRYQSERPGLTSVEYEEANPVNEQIRATRRSDLLNNLSPHDFGGYMCQIATAHPHAEEIHKIITSDRALPMDVESTYARIQTLLQMPNVVANVVNWEVGNVLHKLQAGLTDRFDNETSLCNYAEGKKVDCYRKITGDCAKGGCTACSSAMEAETRQFGCERTQKFIKLISHQFTNFTPTYLEQAYKFSEVCSKHSVLATCAEPQSDVRKILLKAESVELEIFNSDLPTFATGTKNVYLIVGDAIEAVQYVDGDGGTLIAEFIPGLLQYATAKGILTQHISSHNYTLIPFREKFHDAIELGHTYDIRCEQLSGESTKTVKEYGYLALIKARRNASLAKKAYIVPHGVDVSGCRLLVEIYYTEETVPKANGVAIIESGLSFPSTASPEKYKEALKTARERKAGVFELGDEIGASPLLPWELKERFCENEHCEINFIRADEVAVSCTVTNSCAHLNEAHLMIAKSSIPGAGLGLFLRPKPLSCITQIVIPAGKTLCLFSNQGALDASEDSDYALEREVGGRKIMYNPLVTMARTLADS